MAILLFMYVRETTVLQERVEQFMEVAKDLQIRQLSQIYKDKVDIMTRVEENSLNLDPEDRSKDFVNENKVELPDLCKSSTDKHLKPKVSIDSCIDNEI